jgi:hypothetical protein
MASLFDIKDGQNFQFLYVKHGEDLIRGIELNQAVARVTNNTITVYAQGYVLGLQSKKKGELNFWFNFHKGEYDGWDGKEKKSIKRQATKSEEIYFDKFFAQKELIEKGFSSKFDFLDDEDEAKEFEIEFTESAIDKLPKLPEAKSGGSYAKVKVETELERLQARTKFVLDEVNLLLETNPIPKLKSVPDNIVKSLSDLTRLQTELEGADKQLLEVLMLNLRYLIR